MAREMKDSGIEWIGEIPKEWHIMKMNMICSVVTDYVASGSFASLAENVQYLDEPNYAMLIRTADVSGKGHVSKPVYINKQAYEFLSNSNLFGGEIILPNIGGVGEAYIVPKLYEYMSLAPNSIMVKTNYCDKYYYYCFNCEAGSRAIINISQSTAQAKFNKTDFKQIKSILPPLPEQERIATFLDSECARIDEVISKTKSTIEEYKKLKQSVITEAVTKGIRPNREMKDSGIEWIGDIPKAWEVRKLFRAIDCIGDIDHYMPNSSEAGIPYLMTGDLKDKLSKVNFNDCKLVSVEDYQMLSSKIKATKGDVIFARYATIGTVCLVDIDKDFLVSYSCLTIKPTINLLIGKYLFYYFKSNTFFEEIKQYINSNTQSNIGLDSMTKSKVVIPTISEQEEIANYLDEKCTEIDTLIAKKEQIVSELESYKKSLIYEYVTGKKEVV